MNREQKLATLKELAKLAGIKTGRELEYSQPTARLLIDHPHSYRPWRIVGSSTIPGFFYLVSRFRLDHYTDGYAFSEFHLVVNCKNKRYYRAQNDGNDDVWVGSFWGRGVVLMAGAEPYLGHETR